MRNLIPKIMRRVRRVIAPVIPLSIYKRIMPRPLTEFFYHVVSDELLPHIKHLYPYKNTQEFEQDLIYLKANYTLVGYDAILAHHQGKTLLPSNAAHISFDDGFAECYTAARPLLKKHGIPVTIFLVANAVDNRMLMYRNIASLCIEAFSQLSPPEQTAVIEKANQVLQAGINETNQFPKWLKRLKIEQEGQIKPVTEWLGVDPEKYLAVQKPFLTTKKILEMQAEGFTFGAHTLDHPKLMHLPEAEQERQIVASCKAVAAITGRNQVPFAFPFSGAGVSRDLIANIREKNPEVGLIFDVNKLRRDKDFIFNRIWVDQPVYGVRPEKNIEHHLINAYRVTFGE